MVGIIAANNIRFSPYIFYYTKLLEKLNIDYEIIIPNRNPDLVDTRVDKVKIFSWNSRLPAAISYFLYCRKVKKYTCNKFDFLIILTTNIAVFSCRWLKRKFRKKYIVDIRDYTHENSKIFFFREKEVLQSALLRVISSPKFQVFLPKNKYLICHNNVWGESRPEYSPKKEKEKIVIGYVGALAYKSQCQKMMDLIKKDDRFEFHLYGSGRAEEDLKLYAQTLNCERIKFFGIYAPEEKESIIQRVDILFNAYGNSTPLVKYALSNKLYDSFYFCKPILNSPKTFMDEMGGELSFAIDLLNENNLNKLAHWYYNLNFKILNEYAQNQYEKILEEEKGTKQTISQVLLDENRK